MRTEEKDGIILDYPDGLGMAFNPSIIVARGDGLMKIDVTMRSGEKENTLTIDSFKGKCNCDVKDVAQGMFDTSSFGDVDYSSVQNTGLGISVGFEVRAYKMDSVTSFLFSVIYIWGALKVGGKEKFNGNRKLIYFQGLPFTFGIYANGSGIINVSKDGGEVANVKISGQGMWNIPDSFISDAMRYIKVNDGGRIMMNAVFDTTFDYTFRYSDNSAESNIFIEVRERCENGVYLRWVNRHGFYCYYELMRGEDAIKVTNNSLYVLNDLLMYDEKNGYRGTAGVRQTMMREDVVQLCAPLVDSDTWDMLCDLSTSPFVDVFLGYRKGVPEWMSVTVMAASYNKNRSPLQDFLCSILMPRTEVQSL